MIGRRILVSALGAALSAAVAGCDGASSHQPTDGHSGVPSGHGGGQHALGANPKAEMARIKKESGAKTSPGSLPGR